MLIELMKALTSFVAACQHRFAPIRPHRDEDQPAPGEVAASPIGSRCFGRGAGSPRTALALGLAAGVAIAGCQPPSGAPAVSPTEAKSSPSAAELTRAALDGRLAETEAKLDATEGEERRAELASHRLVLTIALVELERRIAAGETAAPNVEGLITSVELMLASRRGFPRRAPSKQPTSGKAAANAPVASEAPPREELEPDLDDLLDDRSRHMKARGKTAKPKIAEDRLDGDGFASSEDESEDEPHAKLESKLGRIEKARVEVESRPRGLMTAVQRQIGAMEACLGQLDADVTLQVTVRMDAGGAVRIAKVGGVAGAPATCLARVLQRVRVPDHDGGTRIVRFPLYFQPN